VNASTRDLSDYQRKTFFAVWINTGVAAKATSSTLLYRAHKSQRSEMDMAAKGNGLNGGSLRTIKTPLYENNTNSR
jgi:hypothetical protein